MESIPVLIIGGGPTGLSMAIELNRYGIPFRIVDKHDKAIDTSNALAAQTRTLEIWDDVGILQNALERGIPIKGANLFSQDKQIATITLNYLKSSFHFLLGISQHETEDMLVTFLKSKNSKVEYQKELVSVVPYEHTVKACLKNTDGQEEYIMADWVIACDGGHSQVREAAGIAFEGKELPQHFVLADLEIQCGLPKDTLNLFTSSKGILAIITYNDKYSRIIVDVTHDPELKMAKTLTFTQVKRLIKERCPFELEMKEPIWTSGFWIHVRMAKIFQVGRIILAGDAAHVHSPAGGQGMNTGIQDANNLAWKLAYIILGIAKPSILETYSIERQHVARNILKGTTLLTTIMTLKNKLLQYLRNQILGWLANSTRFQTLVTNTLTQLNIQYPKNNLVEDCLGHKAGPRAGTRFRDINEILFPAVHGPHATLLCFMGMQDQADVAVYYDLKATLEKHYALPMHFVLVRVKDHFEDWTDYKIFDNDKALHILYGASEPCLYFIRPDKYIGFRGGLDHLQQFNTWLRASFVRKKEC